MRELRTRFMAVADRAPPSRGRALALRAQSLVDLYAARRARPDLLLATEKLATLRSYLSLRTAADGAPPVDSELFELFDLLLSMTLEVAAAQSPADAALVARAFTVGAR